MNKYTEGELSIKNYETPKLEYHFDNRTNIGEGDYYPCKDSNLRDAIAFKHKITDTLYINGAPRKIYSI